MFTTPIDSLRMSIALLERKGILPILPEWATATERHYREQFLSTVFSILFFLLTIIYLETLFTNAYRYN